MITYKRNPNCECSKYKDIDSISSLKEKLSLKEYWMRGYIYTAQGSKECKCHKTFRLVGRYNRLAEKSGLPLYEELSKLNYLGTSDSYKKLKLIPSLIETHNLKDVLAFISGPNNCQKTTSLAKLMYNLIIEEKTVEYYTFPDLIESFVTKDKQVENLLDIEYLIIDDCFEGETINFKNTYNSFYNLLLKRRNPTIICSNFSREQIFNEKSLPSYNLDMLNKIFSKIDKYKTEILFNEDINKQLVLNGKETIDIWSL